MAERNKSIGIYFPVEAAKAYDSAALHYYGDFARLNFPSQATTFKESA